MYGMYNFKEVGVDFLDAGNKDGIHLIDVRTDAEVSRGVIDGAVHIPLHLLPLRADEVPEDKPVVISGARSAQACAFMAAKGYRNMHNLAGGIQAWARSGRPITYPS